MTDQTEPTGGNPVDSEQARPVTPALAPVRAIPEAWVVHVLGPDDVLPAADVLDAVRRAHELNASAVDYVRRHGRTSAPLFWAVPKRASDVAARPDSAPARPHEGPEAPSTLVPVSTPTDVAPEAQAGAQRVEVGG